MKSLSSLDLFKKLTNHGLSLCLFFLFLVDLLEHKQRPSTALHSIQSCSKGQSMAYGHLFCWDCISRLWKVKRVVDPEWLLDSCFSLSTYSDYSYYTKQILRLYWCQSKHFTFSHLMNSMSGKYMQTTVLYTMRNGMRCDTFYLRREKKGGYINTPNENRRKC